MSLDHTYHALADPSRRGMLRRLAQGRSLSVSDLAAPLAIGLPTVMKHLDVLARAGLIERHKSGRTVAVTLAPEPMAEAMRWLERTEAFWSARLDRLTIMLEEETGGATPGESGAESASKAPPENPGRISELKDET